MIEKYYICHQNIFFNFVNLWARTQLAYKYDGNKILFIKGREKQPKQTGRKKNRKKARKTERQ